MDHRDAFFSILTPIARSHGDHPQPKEDPWIGSGFISAALLLEQPC
jgi:hypothetical protein